VTRKLTCTVGEIKPGFQPYASNARSGQWHCVRCVRCVRLETAHLLAVGHIKTWRGQPGREIATPHSPGVSCRRAVKSSCCHFNCIRHSEGLKQLISIDASVSNLNASSFVVIRSYSWDLAKLESAAGLIQKFLTALTCGFFIF